MYEKSKYPTGRLLWFLLFSLMAVSCRKVALTEVDTAAVDDKKKSTSAVASSTIDLPGRTLAANCFQCHGTNGVAGELKIAGESSSEIIGELNEMRAKDPRSNIMNVHALAYTPDEIKLIADFFSKQTN
jgi:sulfide dehydrogenase cytochrome subunit